LKIKKVHLTMVLKLSQQICQGMQEWENLKGILSAYLEPREMRGVRSMMDVCEKLLIKDKIQYGQYKELKEIFSRIDHQICCNIVDEYSNQIQEIQNLPTQQGLL